jgi:hypothetical protein
LKKLLLLARRDFVQARAALLNVDANDSDQIMKQQNEARFSPSWRASS